MCLKSISRTTTRFDTPGYHCFREIHLNARLNINFDRRKDREMDKWTGIQIPMSDPSTSRCDNKIM